MYTVEANVDFAFPAALLALAARFPAPLYAVGGQVRNPLLGLRPTDRDLCSALTPDAVMDFCRAQNIPFVPQGLAYGTVTLYPDGEGYEHTTFRRDLYAPGGAHRPASVAFGDSPETDALRRDFTVNALYVCLQAPRAVLDPTGRGLADLRARRICTTTADPAEILRSDALRILRMVRFAGELGFAIEESTLLSAAENVSGLAAISGERVRDELCKILLCDRKYGAGGGVVYESLARLEALRALDIILPELAACRGVAQRAQYHAYDVLFHMLHACGESRLEAGEAPDALLTLRLAALLHDVGKPEAKRRNAAIPAAHGHMYGHDAISAELARGMLARLRFPNARIDAVCALIARHMFDLTGEAKESTLRERFTCWGYEESLLLAALREADVYGSGRTPRTEEVDTAARFRRVLAAMRAQGAPFSETALRCSGADIMEWTGLPPGKAIGRIKESLLLHCARHPADNTPARLAKLARDRIHMRES